MYYKLSLFQENKLIHMPETGMGYQVVEAIKSGGYIREKYLVLNSEVVIQIDNYVDGYVRQIIRDGILSVKSGAPLIILNEISVLSNNQFYSVINESKKEDEKGAKDNPVENADGKEVFVRLSAFDDDKRVDKINKCLRPGSFTTTMNDYILCKNFDCDPVERYALPNNDKIKFVFHIIPVKSDTLQRGIVQPANGKKGGGEEAYFKNGTSAGTFLKQTTY